MWLGSIAAAFAATGMQVQEEGCGRCRRRRGGLLLLLPQVRPLVVIFGRHGGFLDGRYDRWQCLLLLLIAVWKRVNAADSEYWLILYDCEVCIRFNAVATLQMRIVAVVVEGFSIVR